MNTKQFIPLFLFAIIGLKSMAQSNNVLLPLDSAIQMSLRQSRQLQIDNSKIEAARAK